jgi:hypothetical protein
MRIVDWVLEWVLGELDIEPFELEWGEVIADLQYGR